MKINDILFEKDIMLKELKNITPKTRKKIIVFIGVDINNDYYLLVKIDTKSRFLMRNAKNLIDFVTPLSEINFKKNKKIIFLEAPICSKTKEFLKNNGWKII